MFDSHLRKHTARKLELQLEVARRDVLEFSRTPDAENEAKRKAFLDRILQDVRQLNVHEAALQNACDELTREILDKVKALLREKAGESREHEQYEKQIAIFEEKCSKAKEDSRVLGGVSNVLMNLKDEVERVVLPAIEQAEEKEKIIQRMVARLQRDE